MLNKLATGFTLLEMCLVLCIISMLFLLIPSMFHSSAVLNFECERMVSLIKKAQAIALMERRDVDVEIKGNGIVVDNEFMAFNNSITCNEYLFYFNGRGNINMANTITCHYHNLQKQIVMNLGNGNVYVKQ